MKGGYDWDGEVESLKDTREGGAFAQVRLLVPIGDVMRAFEVVEASAGV